MLAKLSQLLDGCGFALAVPTAANPELLGVSTDTRTLQPGELFVALTGENFDGHHSEWWGLYRSTVGTDTVQDDFTIMGTTYSGWARGDFLENYGR